MTMPSGPKGADGAGGSTHVHSINPTMRVMALVIPGFLTLSVAYVLYAVADYVLSAFASKLLSHSVFLSSPPVLCR